MLKFQNQRMTDDIKSFVKEWESWLKKQSSKYKNNQQASEIAMRGAV